MRWRCEFGCLKAVKAAAFPWIFGVGVAAALARGAELPVASGAELTLVADGFAFTEGPATDAKGDVYFTDQPNDRIMKWDAAGGTVSLFLQPSGRANGLHVDSAGRLLSCADEHGELQRINVETKTAEVLVDGFGGKLFNGPNDVWPHPDGGIYFTDPFYKRPYWKNRDKPDQQKQRVFFLPKGAKTPVVADDTLVQPNGIIGSPDGKKLFVADIGDRKTYVYQIEPGGTLSGRALFCAMGSDGMTLDTEGNLYLTGKGVTVFDKTGREIGNIPVPESWTANVTFGGPDRKTLFITAMDSVYTLRMKVAGVR